MNTTIAQGRIQRISQVCPFDLDWPFQTLLEQLYAQHGNYRAYHNLRHLEELAAAFVAVRDRVGWEKPDDVFAALLMHDAILDLGQRDNELRSAELAQALLPALLPRGRGRINVWHVAALIRLTAQHGRIAREGLGPDARHFLDCDMAILGADRQRFLEYHADVAREYEGTLPREDYRRGRRGFVEWLVRPEHRIFLSDFFHELLEERAKANLRVALEVP